MKKFLLLLLAISPGFVALAQKIAMPTTPVTDSIQARRLKTNKIQQVNGIRMGTANDIVENTIQAMPFTTLAGAIRAAGLTETFKSRGPITLFAPTNAAFQKVSTGKLDTLMRKSHNLEMVSLLTCHAVQGHLSIKDLTRQINAGKGKATLKTLGGCNIFATIDANRNIVLTDENGVQGIIETFDIEQSNGLIHVINNVLMTKNKTI